MLIIPEKPAGPLLPVVPRRGGTGAPEPTVAWQPDPGLHPAENDLPERCFASRSACQAGLVLIGAVLRNHPLISLVGCGGTPARDAGRATGPRPSTARRAARSVVVPVARPGDHRATDGCAPARPAP